MHCAAVDITTSSYEIMRGGLLPDERRRRARIERRGGSPSWLERRTLQDAEAASVQNKKRAGQKQPKQTQPAETRVIGCVAL